LETTELMHQFDRLPPPQSEQPLYNRTVDHGEIESYQLRNNVRKMN
jgi:hypothetical protein